MKRATYVMVPEDDPQWTRFWELFPNRVAKKEARKAWAKLNPTPELTERILAALQWQIPAYQWDGAKAAFCPYPASYLNSERWTDERRSSERRQQADIRGHFPPCRTNHECIAKVLADAKAGRAEAS